MTIHGGDGGEAAPSPSAVRLHARFDRDAEPATGGSAWPLVRVIAQAAPAAQRPPLNLAAVLDRSVSLAGAKLERTKRVLTDGLIPTAVGEHLRARVELEHGARRDTIAEHSRRGREQRQGAWTC